MAGVHQGVKTILNFVNFVNISRFFFFTAFSTCGGGCDPRNDRLPTWSSPPCPCSPPKVSKLLDSHAHQHSNPPPSFPILHFILSQIEAKLDKELVSGAQVGDLPVHRGQRGANSSSKSNLGTSRCDVKLQSTLDRSSLLIHFNLRSQT